MPSAYAFATAAHAYAAAAYAAAATDVPTDAAA